MKAVAIYLRSGQTVHLGVEKQDIYKLLKDLHDNVIRDTNEPFTYLVNGRKVVIELEGVSGFSCTDMEET